MIKRTTAGTSKKARSGKATRTTVAPDRSAARTTTKDPSRLPDDDGQEVKLTLTENARTVLQSRYLERDSDGEVIETPEQLFQRVARSVAAIESKWGASAEKIQTIERSFLELMADRLFMPNSPTLMNAGRPLGMLSACFVLPLEDSIPDIMETARQIALVQRAGGGTGVDLSRLRPRGSVVRSSGGRTDGPLSFLQMLSSVTDAIQQGAFRRGANMGMLRVDHPDILAFIDIKSDLGQVNNYNLSVSMTDTFMKTLEENPRSVHRVRDPNTGRWGALRRSDEAVEYGVNEDGDSASFLTVRDVWERVIGRAWDTGEPGLIFIDEVNRGNQTPHVFEMRATNPCGEQPLGPYEACNLGSLNLAGFHREGGDDPIDWDGMTTAVQTCVRFLDDVVEVNRYPTPEIDAACRANRKIGLGIMGWADLLFQMGIRYDSDEALDLARRIGDHVREAAWDASTELAEERGCFPNWKGSTWDVEHGRKMRNAHCVTIAPTGTISILASCSGGIEPIFSLAFTRQILDGEVLHEVNPVFKEAVEREVSADAAKDIIASAAERGSVQDRSELSEETRDIFRTSRDIDPTWHVRMQAAWQEHTDAAVSKTINLPSTAKTEDVESAYLLAYRLQCKGITVYRDGSRPVQPMALKGEAKKKADKPAEAKIPELPPKVSPISLPELMPCVRVRQLTPFGNMHVKISVEPRTGIEREVFAQLGKGGDLATSDLEAICRILSLFLRCNGDLELAVGQLEGIGSSLSVPSREGRIMSLADGLAHALRLYLRTKERVGLKALLLGEVKPEDLHPDEQAPETNGDGNSSEQATMFKVKCPDCSGTLTFSEGCVKCASCGYSQC